MTEQAREIMIRYADEHLAPYKIKTKTGGDEIIPQVCPFCHGGSSGDRYTFALSLEKGLFVCKRGSCGRHGHFDQLVWELSGETIRLPSDQSRKSSRKSSSSQDPVWVLPQVELSPPTAQIYEYFRKRGISEETVDAFRIQSDNDGMIVFPFYERGSLIFVKYRRPWKPTKDELRVRGKEWQVPGTKQILFNLDSVDYSQPVYLTEGMVDAMALYEAGIHNVVSVPSGCENMNWVANCWDTLEKIQQFVLFGDNDEPGRRMVSQVSKRLGEYRCRVVSSYPEIPDGGGALCKDADEILVRLGGFELLDVAESAEEIEIHGLIDIGDIAAMDPTQIPRISTKIPKLDECLGGWTEGSVVVVSGESGQGKSTFTSQLLLTAIQAGHKVCAYSGELSKEKFLLWLSFQAAGYQYVGLKYDSVLNKSVPYISPEVQSRIQKWLKGRAFLYDNKVVRSTTQAAQIIELFTVAAKRYGCSVFLVDNLMSSLCDEEEEIKAQGQFINDLKRFADQYNAYVLCVAHPRKTKPGMQMGRFDVAGSALIVNFADAAFVVERPDIRVIKSRDTGVEAKIACCYEPASRRIYQADTGDLNNFGWDRTGIIPPKELAASLPEYHVTLSDNTGSAPF